MTVAVAVFRSYEMTINRRSSSLQSLQKKRLKPSSDAVIHMSRMWSGVWINRKRTIELGSAHLHVWLSREKTAHHQWPALIQATNFTWPEPNACIFTMYFQCILIIKFWTTLSELIWLNKDQRLRTRYSADLKEFGWSKFDLDSAHVKYGVWTRSYYIFVLASFAIRCDFQRFSLDFRVFPRK